MGQLTQLIYVSSAVVPFSEQQLRDLLILARDANKTHQISGLLLYKDGNFMQAIEGDESDIDQLFSNITRDSSHTGVICLLKEPVAQRDFSGWSMGFRKLSSKDPEGFSDFLAASAHNTLLPGSARSLLLSFNRT